MAAEEKINPDVRFEVNWLDIWLDDFSPDGVLVNLFLSMLCSRKRSRILIFEDRIVARGIWTPEEAKTAAQYVEMGDDRYYHLPKDWRESAAEEAKRG